MRVLWLVCRCLADVDRGQVGSITRQSACSLLFLQTVGHNNLVLFQETKRPSFFGSTLLQLL